MKDLSIAKHLSLSSEVLMENFL